MNKGHGFKKPIELPEDYKLGSSPLATAPLVDASNHHWTSFLPKDEFQLRNGLETMNCTVYGTLNAIETLLMRKFGVEADYSERYVGILAGTDKDGNDPQKVAETIRKVSGLIPDSLLPFSDNINEWKEYYSPNPPTSNQKEEGKKWSRQWDFKHEYVKPFAFKTMEHAMKYALRISPLGVAVNAWAYDDDRQVYFRNGEDNHWCMMYDYADGKHWYLFDQYDSTHKKLAWDYGFETVKRYSIEKKKEEVPKVSWFRKFFFWL